MKRKPQYYLYSICNIILAKLYNIKNKFVFWYWGINFGKNLNTFGNINILNMNFISLGDNCRLISGYGNFVGGSEKLSFYTGQNGYIKIGNNTGISSATLISQKGIEIGEYVFIGGGTKIYDNDFHQLRHEDRMIVNSDIPSAKIIIKDRVFIGGHSIILKGVVIGENAVIGAGSLVTKSIPENEIWAGVPAKFIKLNQWKSNK